MKLHGYKDVYVKLLIERDDEQRAENIQRRRDGMEPLSEDPASFSKPIPEPSRYVYYL